MGVDTQEPSPYSRGMRSFLLLSSFALASVGLFAQNSVLAHLEDSVFQVVQQVLLPKDSTEPALWTALEKHIGEPIRGTYLTLSTGTGFFVDSEGRALTNHHVIEKGNESQRMRELIKLVQDFISDRVPDAVLTPDEKFRLRIDVAKMLKAAVIEIRARAPSGANVSAQILSDQEKLDLALLRIGVSSPTKPLLIRGNSSTLAVGVSVWAAGLPVPNVFDALFRENRVTVTQGIVSATRDDVWGLQHTAAINPGNSGGPLLDEQGRVVGVNVARITNSNGLFFAIDLAKLELFFQNSSHLDVWQSNVSLSDQRPTVATMLEKTVGDTVVLNAIKGTEVYEAGKRIGVVPLVLELTKKTTMLTLQGASGDATVVLNRDTSIQQTTTVDVILQPRSGIVEFSSSPLGATLVVDGVAKGRTPLSLSLPGGEHRVQWKLNDYSFEEAKVVVKPDEKTSVSATGTRLVAIQFARPLPPGTRLSWTATGKTQSVVDPSPWLVPEGRMVVRVENPDYFDPIEFPLDSKNPLVDNTNWYGKGQVVFRNVAPETILLVDGERFGAVNSGTEVPLSVGRHELKFVSSRYQEYSITVDVKRTAPLELFVAQRVDRASERGHWLGIWGYSTLGLAAVSATTLAMGYNQYNAEMQDNLRTGSVPEANLLMRIGGYTGLAAGITALFFYIALNQPVL